MDCGDEAQQVEESLLESHDDVEGSVATDRQESKGESGLRLEVCGVAWASRWIKVLAWIDWRLCLCIYVLQA